MQSGMRVSLASSVPGPVSARPSMAPVLAPVLAPVQTPVQILAAGFMTHIVLISLIAIAGMLGASPARAVPITLTFNEFANPDSLAVAAGSEVAYSNPNHMVYGNVAPNILLGDDGYSGRMSVMANAGTLFDAVSIDLIEARNAVFEAPVNPGVILDPWTQMFTAQTDGTVSQYIYENLIFEGYRWDQLVATTAITFDGSAAATHHFSSDFADLNRLDITVDFAGARFYGPMIEGDKVMYCEGSCGYVRFDNLSLDTQSQAVAAAAVQTVTTVPVPASGLILGSGLGLLFWVGRRMRLA